MVGPPALELDGDEGTGQQPLCFVDQTNHDMRIGWYTDTYRRTDDGWRLRTRSMTFLRKSGARDSGRAHDPTRPAPTAAERLPWSSTSSGPRSTGGSTTTTTSSPPTTRAGGTLDEQMAQLSKVKRLTYDAGWMRWGWPERVGGLGGSTLLRGLPRRGPDRPRPGRARHLLDDRGAGADDDRLRPARAGGRDGAAAAPRRRDLVPGVLRAGHRQQPRRRSPAAAVRTDDGWRVTGQKVWTSLAQYAAALRAADPHRRTRVRPPRHHGAVRRHGQPGHHGPPDRDDARPPEFCEVFFDDVLVPVDRTLGDEGQGWAVAMDLLPFERSTALWHRAAFLHRRLAGAARRRAAGRARPGRGGRGDPACSTPSGRAPGRRSTAWRPASTSAPRPRSTRSCWPPPSRPCSTWRSTGWPTR